MIACELVTAAALSAVHARPVTARRVCLATLIRQAHREGAVVVEVGGRRRVWLAPKVAPPLSVAEVLEVTR